MTTKMTRIIIITLALLIARCVSFQQQQQRMVLSRVPKSSNIVLKKFQMISNEGSINTSLASTSDIVVDENRKRNKTLKKLVPLGKNLTHTILLEQLSRLLSLLLL